MRFLADENVPRLFVDWLRSKGHDVVSAADIAPGQADQHWLMTAERDLRIVVTADKDFGQLVFRNRLNGHGVILLRLFDLDLHDRLLRVQQVWGVIEANPSGRFIVVTSKRVRVRMLSGQ